MKANETPMIKAKIERGEDEETLIEDDATNPNPDPHIKKIKELVEDFSTIRKARRLSDINVEPEIIGYVECPTCSYMCEGLFQHNTVYNHDNPTFADDVCKHLKYVKNDYAYFVESH